MRSNLNIPIMGPGRPWSMHSWADRFYK